MVISKLSSVFSSSIVKIPALLINTSNLRKYLLNSLQNLLIDENEAKSNGKTRIFLMPDVFSICSFAFSPSDLFLHASIKLLFAFANLFATAYPIPRFAPVMRIIFSLMLVLLSFNFLLSYKQSFNKRLVCIHFLCEWILE